MKGKNLKKTFKNVTLVAAVLIFAFGVLSVSVFKARGETLAAAKPVLKFSISPSPTVIPTSKPEVKYYLPYPGILPDHPLYFLKMIRDRIWLWLTVDSLKKAEVLLLFADKRLGAGKFLIEGNKPDLGLTTLEKAEKYLERAATQLEIAKSKGKDITKLKEKLNLATFEHERVINELSGGRAEFNRILEYPQKVRTRISQNLE